MRPRTVQPRHCCDCGRTLGRYSTADRCWDCFAVWMRGPLPYEPDWVVVDRLIGGIPVEATAEERAEAVRIMTERGLSADAIAQRMHCSARSVVRLRSFA